VFGGGALQFLYGRGRWLTDHVLTGSLAHRIYGSLQRTRRSRNKIRDFVSSLGIDASEAELPLEAYRSLDDFFTRRLRPGARVVERDPRRLVSPCDARVLVIPELAGAALQVKGTSVSVEELLGDIAAAARYQRGAALVARLAPADYHRFHFPDDGTASAAQAVAGKLHSVHPIALAAGAPSLRNRRMVSVLESARFGALAIVEVGALCVGTIEQTYQPGEVVRGQEKGLFRFGGSTVIVLVERGRLRFDDDLVDSSARGLETLLHMGEGVATLTGGA